MMESLKRLFQSRVYKVFVFTLLLVLGIAIAFDFYYDLNDDTTIKDIISGAYTESPSGYSIQMLFPLSFCLSLCYRAIPGIPWYGLFLCVCQFGVAVLIAWRVTGLVRKQWKQYAALAFELVIFLGLLLRQLVIVQYSVTCGICMAGAIFLYITGDEKKLPREYLRQNVLPIGLVILAFMIRTEMCIMLLPFLLLAGLAKWMAQEKVFTLCNLKRYFYVLAAAFLGMLMVLSIDKLSYVIAENGDEWKAFQSFFDARTSLYDFYGIPQYEDNEEFYREIGLARESYTLLENYNFALDDSIDEHLLKRLVEYQKEQTGNGNGLTDTAGFISKNSLSEALWVYKEQIIHMKSGVYAFVLLAAYISYILLAGARKKSNCYWKVALLLVIRSVLWIYLFMVDRALERITCPLLVTEIMVLLGWTVQESLLVDKESERFVLKRMQIIGVYVLLLVCSMFAFKTNLQKTTEEYEAREDINSRWEALIDYCKEQENSYFVIDVYSSTSYQGISYSEKIFKGVDNSYRNFDLCGGWLSKSPLMYEKLAQRQIDELESALYGGKEVYFVAMPQKDLQWLIDYYAFRGKEIKPKKVDTIYDDKEECFAVYQLH